MSRVSWVMVILLVLYAVGLGVAAYYGMSPWVFVYGTLGAAGIAIVAVFGAFHTRRIWVRAVLVGLGVWSAYHMALPVYEWRTVLSGAEVWNDLVLGSIGILALASGAVFFLQGHCNWQWFVGVTAVLAVVALCLGRPAGAQFTLLPPIPDAPSIVRPETSAGRPGFGRPGSSTPARPQPVVRKAAPPPPTEMTDPNEMPDMFQ